MSFGFGLEPCARDRSLFALSSLKAKPVIISTVQVLLWFNQNLLWLVISGCNFRGPSTCWSLKLHVPCATRIPEDPHQNGQHCSSGYVSEQLTSHSFNGLHIIINVSKSAEDSYCATCSPFYRGKGRLPNMAGL